MTRARILVADDEPLIRLSLREALESEGYHVVEASNGREAFEIFEKEDFALVISDVRMPEEDGLALLGRIRGSGRAGVPVILLTGHSGLSRADLLARGATEFFPKPFDVAAFLEAVARSVAI